MVSVSLEMIDTLSTCMLFKESLFLLKLIGRPGSLILFTIRIA